MSRPLVLLVAAILTAVGISIACGRGHAADRREMISAREDATAPIGPPRQVVDHEVVRFPASEDHSYNRKALRITGTVSLAMMGGGALGALILVGIADMSPEGFDVGMDKLWPFMGGSPILLCGGAAMGTAVLVLKNKRPHPRSARLRPMASLDKVGLQGEVTF